MENKTNQSPKLFLSYVNVFCSRFSGITCSCIVSCHLAMQSALNQPKIVVQLVLAAVESTIYGRLRQYNPLPTWPKFLFLMVPIA